MKALRCGVFLTLALCSVPCLAREHSEAELEWCTQAAASQYYVPTYPIPYAAFLDLIRAVRAVENGCGKVVKNTNGSVDVGCMQINSVHFTALAAYGIGRERLEDDCQNILVGTWILDSELRHGGDLWSSIGNYNSHTPRHNQAYQRLVWGKLQRLWADRLAGK